MVASGNEDRDELHRLLALFASIGGTLDGGVRRLTGSPEDGLARDALRRDHAARGFSTLIDPVGNMFGYVALTDPDQPIILTGSHLDSQETGGRLDGTYGVVASLIAASRVRRRALAEPGAVKRNLAVVNWTNEEGARFQPSLTGSSVFVQRMTPEAALSLTDDEGRSLGSALAGIGYLGRDVAPTAVHHYLELHIEQGPELEARGIDVGAVTGAWAAQKLHLQFDGAPSHTGPTPMGARRDALHAAARAVQSLHAAGASVPGLHVSAARMTVYPNSPNVVASRVQVWFEFRHEDEDIAVRFGDRFHATCRSDAEAMGVSVSIVSDERRGMFSLDSKGVSVVEAACETLGYSCMRMKTVAGHDALAVQRRFPASLIFVPSKGGISHSPLEDTAPLDLEHGLDVLSEALWTLVTSTS